MGSKGSMITGGVFHSQKGGRERFSRNRCTLPPQVYYMEFQEARVQREFLVMLDISGVLTYSYCYFYSVQQPHQSMFLLSIYYDMNVLDWVFCIDHCILSSYLRCHSLLAHSGEDSKQAACLSYSLVLSQLAVGSSHYWLPQVLQCNESSFHKA